MKLPLVLLSLVVLIATAISAQDKTLPYYEIPAYPEAYTAGAVAARVVDGLGFRYFWATEGLRSEDLSHKPSAEARTSLETITHIYELTLVIVNSTTKTANVRSDNPPMTFEEMRRATLENIKAASDRLKASSEKDLQEFDMVFKRGESTTEYPFWNELNGPIADAIWHVGQVVSFRRSSGNPFNSKAGVLTGKVRE
ncbi:MAG: hypothetical protein JJE09_11945 [Bacteroidia bacterium]|nr:hypothetical protein [Bacteroidia bacterium]